MGNYIIEESKTVTIDGTIVLGQLRAFVEETSNFAENAMVTIEGREGDGYGVGARTRITVST